MIPMRLVIAGAGEVGYHLTEALSGEADIRVIDLDDVVLKHLEECFHVRTLQANSAHQETLRKAQVDKADLFIAVTDRDDANLLSCLVAKELGSPTTIARVKQLSTSGNGVSQFNNIDLLINPYEVVADHLEQLIIHPQVTDIATFMGGRMLLVRISVAESLIITGQTVEKLGRQIREKIPCLIAAIQRTEMSFVPGAQDMIQDGDQLYLFCPTQCLKQLLKILQIRRKSGRRVFINGGGNIGLALACRLEKHGLGVRVLEVDPEQCQVISRTLRHGLVLQADGMELPVLQEEGIKQADYFVSLTADDSVNISACLLVSEYSNCRTAALFKQPQALPLINRYRLIDHIFSPRLLTAMKILQYLRGRNLQNYLSLENSDIELLEICLQSSQNYLNIPLHQLKLPKEVLVGAICRNGKIFLPRGEDCLQAEDSLLIIQHKKYRAYIRKRFSGTQGIKK